MQYSIRISTNANNVAFSASARIGIRFNKLVNNSPTELDYCFLYLDPGELNKVKGQVLNTLTKGPISSQALIISISH